MKRIVVAACVLVCLGIIATTVAQENDYLKTQGQVLECSPPKFLLVSDVDMNAKTLTGMSTFTSNNPQPAVAAFHMTFKLSDIEATNARRVAVDDADLAKLKGKLVVLYDGKDALNAAYLRLFQEDTIVISIVPNKK